jgi:hypothetical protein
MRWTLRRHDSRSGRLLLEKSFQVVEEAIEALASRKRLSTTQRRAFRAMVLRRLERGDYEALARYRPVVPLESYLGLLVGRLYGEYREQLQASFRESLDTAFDADAALLIEKLVTRHVRLEPEAAIRVMRTKFPALAEAGLRELLRGLPPCEGLLDGWTELLDSVSGCAAATNEAAALVPAELQLRIAALPVADRQLVELVYFRGLTNGEAAALLGVRVQTMVRRLHAVLDKLGITRGDGGPGREAAVELHLR